ncbi:MAG: hypothetical protein J6Q22_10340 [Prevotella sp.]|nr:hypothetical protein [Prevotella sp.]
MNRKLIRSTLLLTSIAAFSVVTSTAISAMRGVRDGTVVVSNVLEFINAAKTVRQGDVIIVSEVGSPYYLEEQQSMSRAGHLYITNGITIKGRTGNAEDVVLIGSTNRLMYIDAVGCSISGLTFANGNCMNNLDTTNSPRDSLAGGAIYLGRENNECIISNCVFTNNFAIRGGAIASSKSYDYSSAIIDCRFIENRAEFRGGAIYRGGTISESEFLGNEASTNGGAVAAGYAKDCKFERNRSRIGSICSESKVYDCTIADIGEEGTNRFYDCYIDRCRFHVTNGVIFSGYCDVRNTLISDGENFTLAKSIWHSYNLWFDEDWKLSQIICSTIVSNKDYKLASPNKNYDVLKLLNLYYDFFYGNTYPIDGYYKINWDYVTNGCYKSVAMSKGEMLAAYGWQGDSYTNWVVDLSELHIEIDRPNLNNRKGDIPPDSQAGRKFGDPYFRYSYKQYYFAYGWDGWADRIDVSMGNKARTNTVTAISSYLLDEATTNLTWDAYYRSLGWKGESDYISTIHNDPDCDINQKGREACGTIYGCIIRPDPKVDFSSMTNCCFYNPTNGIIPCFSLDKSHSNPYSIETNSPAYHGNYSRYFEYPNDIPMTNGQDNAWMLESKDLSDKPRLYRGGLDIGAYQASP